MKNKKLILIFAVLLTLTLSLLWPFESEIDVKIVEIQTPPLGAQIPEKLTMVLQNNESKPVDVWVDIENAFVDENKISYPTSRIIISENSTHPWDVDFVSFQKPITLQPGNNSIKARLGYSLPGKYELKIKVTEDSRLIDSASHTLEILPPKLSLKLEAEKFDWPELDLGNEVELYGIYGYILNYSPSRAKDLRTNLSVRDEKTGKTVFTASEVYYVEAYDKTPLWIWPDYPYALIEISRSGTSDKTYMPVQNVIRGKPGDVFRVNVSSEWENQKVFAEILVPIAEERNVKNEKEARNL
ncbi:MAG: hypothetical protein PHD41_03140 [Methanosarcinaceae archaeon]|nr:hypothetical protein [Methanosarcinaceae archaeon]MDD4749590.1 hypothetical protein [Methanosarcinaceae archaeon]